MLTDFREFVSWLTQHSARTRLLHNSEFYHNLGLTSKIRNDKSDYNDDDKNNR